MTHPDALPEAVEASKLRAQGIAAGLEMAARIADQIEQKQANDHGAANTGGAAETSSAIRALITPADKGAETSSVDEAFATIRAEIDTLRNQRDRSDHLLTTVIVNLRRGGDPAVVVPALLEWHDGGCK